MKLYARCLASWKVLSKEASSVPLRNFLTRFSSCCCMGCWRRVFISCLMALMVWFARPCLTSVLMESRVCCCRLFRVLVML